MDILSGFLRDMPKEVKAVAVPEGVRGAIAPILVAAKRFLRRSRDTGATIESMTTKVVNYPNRGKCVGLVGPDRSYYRGRKKVGALGALFGASRPANTAHLLEYGHHVVAPVKGTSRRKKTAKTAANGRTWVKPKPFIRPAVHTTGPAQAAGFEAGLASGFLKARNKLIKAGAHSS
jgi:hypothetical protein